MSSEKEKTHPKAPGRGRRIRMSLMSVMVALTFGEVFLRAISLPFVEPRDFVAGEDANRAFEFDFETMWRYPEDPVEKWGIAASDEKSNQFGCRGYEPSTRKNSDDLRIVCVGSSCAAGFGVPLGWSFPIYLERALQAKYPRARVETVLGGIAGYSSEQQRALLLGRLNNFRPDLVVFLTGTHNDLAAAPDRNDQENLDRLRPGFSRTIDLLRFKYGIINRLISGGRRIDYRGHDGQTDDLRVPLHRFRENLDVMFKWVARGGGQSVVIKPFTKDVQAMRAVYRKVVEEEAIAHGLAVVDMETAARHEGDWLDAMHLTRRGHEALAKAILAQIDKGQLLPAKCKNWLGPPPEFQLDEVRPKSVIVGGDRLVRLQVSGLKKEELSRIWCSGQLVEHRWLGAKEIEIRLPRLMPAQRGDIEIVTSRGSRVFEGVLEVLPCNLDAEFLLQDDEIRIEFKLNMPESATIAITATPTPQEKAVRTGAGLVWLAQGDTWTPQNDNRKTFFADHVLTHGQSFHRGLFRTSWLGKRTMPSGTRIAFQGLLGIPGPGNFHPVTVTTPYFYTVP